MNEKEFVGLCKKAVADYANQHLDKTDSKQINIRKKRPSNRTTSFGARDGTRTHTAVATRTSNVIVYHSNTLAKLDYYTQ